MKHDKGREDTRQKVINTDTAGPKEVPLREQLLVNLFEKLGEDGAPAQVLEIYRLQFDLCCSAFEVGSAAAQRLLIEKKITQQQVFEVTMEFTRFVSARVNMTPAGQQIVGAPAGVDLSKIPPPGTR